MHKQVLAKLDASSREHRIIHAIQNCIDESNADECLIVNAQISKLTGISISNISRLLYSLVGRNVICLGKGHCRTIRFNPNLEEWQLKKGKVTATAKAGPKAKAATCKKSLPVDKPKSRSAKNVTPEWFKELWKMYPAHRRGGNYSFGWKKWQSMSLTEDDASKAKEWLLAAAKVDVAWAKDATSGFAFGLARFINESHWRTPVPVKPMSQDGYKQPDLENMDYTKGWKGFDVVGR